MQGLLRNPLAEPGVVGVSGSAALGATLAFTPALPIAPLALPLGGIAGALGAVIVLFIIAGRRAETTTLLLAGIAINAITGALTALVLNLSPNPFAAMEIIFWQMGSLADRSLLHLQLAGPLMARLDSDSAGCTGNPSTEFGRGDCRKPWYQRSHHAETNNCRYGTVRRRRRCGYRRYRFYRFGRAASIAQTMR